ncbi:hypothetical protein KKH3_11550 [Pectobacterium actinidiae]|nr:hypothetical protein KKH3_11550 [Pectobacterium actinidiae]
MHNDFVISWLQIMWSDEPAEEEFAGICGGIVAKKSRIKIRLDVVVI